MFRIGWLDSGGLVDRFRTTNAPLNVPGAAVAATERGICRLPTFRLPIFQPERKNCRGRWSQRLKQILFKGQRDPNENAIMVFLGAYR